MTFLIKRLQNSCIRAFMRSGALRQQYMTFRATDYRPRLIACYARGVYIEVYNGFVYIFLKPIRDT